MLWEGHVGASVPTTQTNKKWYRGEWAISVTNWIWRLRERTKQKAVFCSLTIQLSCAALCSESGLELGHCHTLAQAFSFGFPGVKFISQELILQESHPERKQKEANPEPGQPRHTDGAQTPLSSLHTACAEAWKKEEGGPGSPEYFSKAQRQTAPKILYGDKLF